MSKTIFEIGGFIFNEKLGHGAYGEVFKAMKRGDPQRKVYAGKIIKISNLKQEKNFRNLQNEIQLLKGLKHENIIELKEVFHSNNNIYLIEEYMNGGNLEDYLSTFVRLNRRPLNEEEAKCVMVQVLKAVYFLHSKNVIHRDLKPQNIMLHYKNESDMKNLNIFNATVKIIDFGVSRTCLDENLTTFTGTLKYLAPEIAYPVIFGNSKPLYNFKADVWCLGVIFYQLLTNNLPCIATDLKELRNKLKFGPTCRVFEVPKNASKDAVSFLDCMLQVNPDFRKSVADLCAHPFIVGKSNVWNSLPAPVPMNVTTNNSYNEYMAPNVNYPNPNQQKISIMRLPSGLQNDSTVNTSHINNTTLPKPKQNSGQIIIYENDGQQKVTKIPLEPNQCNSQVSYKTAFSSETMFNPIKNFLFNRVNSFNQNNKNTLVRYDSEPINSIKHNNNNNNFGNKNIYRQNSTKN